MQIPVHLLRHRVINILYISTPPSIKILILLLISQCNNMQRKHSCCSVSLQSNISSAQTLEKTRSSLTNKHSSQNKRELWKCGCCPLLGKHFSFLFQLHCVLSSCDIQWPNTIQLGLVQNSSYMVTITEPFPLHFSSTKPCINSNSLTPTQLNETDERSDPKSPHEKGKALSKLSTSSVGRRACPRAKDQALHPPLQSSC